MIAFDTIDRAVSDLADGLPVVIVDDALDEGSLVFAAHRATTALVAFSIRHSGGYLCVALRETDCERLALPAMCPIPANADTNAYTVTVDARTGIGTGISACDRAVTIRLLADPATTASDLTRPGHVQPVRAATGGVLMRPNRTEAALDLLLETTLPPAAAIADLVSVDSPSGMSHTAELRAFADQHRLAIITISDLVAHRRTTEPQVRRRTAAPFPTLHGNFQSIEYLGNDGAAHLALSMGELHDPITVSVSVHFECIPGQVLASTRCQCRLQLDAAMSKIAADNRGILLYLRPPAASTGPGDTRAPSPCPPFAPHRSPAEPADSHSAVVVSQILADLGVSDFALLGGGMPVRRGLPGTSTTAINAPRNRRSA
ncbi:3,4-dihydroxy-2-butanone-4-phosphate synthase [Rhodococcus sp. G-MC3]|uniref:3,4-dihydroxy-2-butanone-4-phosphate synthase n=1 Tax=Rhodococcus sp. G-MC3 TaxID=3046209 RepID=UPI0024BAB7BB|nr:3,4-dihydroxy-2-butanone-4-phosphate synthase [Rhodococcus sp. G-MC3]MDJ0396569.1 3,4-dihydroxy-2-butanone-4-phosphate synthase [Rhodococcus sp. G-MC3]